MTASQRQHADCPNAVREDALPCLAKPTQRVRGTYPQLDLSIFFLWAGPQESPQQHYREQECDGYEVFDRFCRLDLA